VNLIYSLRLFQIIPSCHAVNIRVTTQIYQEPKHAQNTQVTFVHSNNTHKHIKY